MQWGYHKLDLNDVRVKSSDVDLLNTAGADGWDLVTVVGNNIAYFKRQIKEPATARRRKSTPSANAPPDPRDPPTSR